MHNSEQVREGNRVDVVCSLIAPGEGTADSLPCVLNLHYEIKPPDTILLNEKWGETKGVLVKYISARWCRVSSFQDFPYSPSRIKSL